MEHLLQTQGLGAELDFSVDARYPPHLVFNRDRSSRMQFYDVSPADQPVLIGVERQGPQLPYPITHGDLTGVGPLVGQMAPDREDVFVKGLLHVDQRALSGTVAEMFQGGDRNEDFLLSASPLGVHLTRVVSVIPGRSSSSPSGGRVTL